jgi:ketosteroid isomerase-like protein
LLAPYKLARFAPCAVVLCALIANFAANAGSCVSTPADKAQVVEALRTMYAAASADNFAKLHTVAAPDFYAFDGGKRYDGDALMSMAKGFHTQGYTFVWTVTDPHVEADCHLAWITYTNRGSIQAKGGAPQPTTWLESAALEKQKGTWRIRFFHSTRVP